MFSKLSAWVEELTIELSDCYARAKNVTFWAFYLSGTSLKNSKSPRLRDDFPHLKRLTIVLTDGCLLYEPSRLRELCNTFGRNVVGLDWVHIVGLNNEDVVPSLKPMAEAEHLMDHHRQRVLQAEQNKRLLRMAIKQADHKPEDVALQQELGDLRIDILNQRLVNCPQPSLSPSFVPCTHHGSHGNHALQDYQMQLMLLEQQRKRRLLVAREEQEGYYYHLLPQVQKKYQESEARLRWLRTWARHARNFQYELSEEVSSTESLMQQLQSQIDEIILQKATRSKNPQLGSVDFAEPSRGPLIMD
ncbi:MAG: hypothetical protein Q9166_006813 [cf. Caloplaca sp. 2 TL-2023]